jgi:uncharacterized RDD family membrane protein YckC
MADKRFGGFWRRLFAYLIDNVILYLVSLVLLLVGLLALELGGNTLGRALSSGIIPRGMGVFPVVYVVTTIITGMGYFTWFHGAAGQTPGKMLLGLRVIQTSGVRMTFGVAFLRCVGYLISSLFFWLGFLWIAFDGRKQGWHDKIAATLVVRVRVEPVNNPLGVEEAPPSGNHGETAQPPGQRADDQCIDSRTR